MKSEYKFAFVFRKINFFYLCYFFNLKKYLPFVLAWLVSFGAQLTCLPYPTDEKYHMLPSGELLVRDVSSDDVTKRFLCRTVHLMTDQHVISQQPAKVVLRGG